MKLDARRLTLVLVILLIVAALVLFISSAITPPAITVAWSTASELNTAGFNVLRSTSADGPFMRINSEVIPASNDPLVGGSYTYTDTQVSLGQTYYYRVEEVEFGGGTALQPDMDKVTLSGPNPILLIMGAGIAVITIALLVWSERPRRSAAQP